MKSILLFFTLVLAFAGCEQEYDYNIKVIEKDGYFAVYDINFHFNRFIYRKICDSAILDKDSIVTGFVNSKSRYCYHQSKTFKGYSTKDSAEFAANEWRIYGYGKNPKQ